MVGTFSAGIALLRPELEAQSLKEHISVVLLFPSTMELCQKEMSVHWNCVVVVVLKV